MYISNFCNPIENLQHGAIGEWSEELRSIAVELEVRYSGESQPVKNFTTFDLQFQTIEQNNADLIQFISYFSQTFPQYVCLFSY